MKHLKTKETVCHAEKHGTTKHFFERLGCRCPETVENYIKAYTEHNAIYNKRRRYVDWVILHRAQSGEIVGHLGELSLFEHRAVFIHLVKLGRSNKEIARIMKYDSRNASTTIAKYKKSLRSQGML